MPVLEALLSHEHNGQTLHSESDTPTGIHCTSPAAAAALT